MEFILGMELFCQPSIRNGLEKPSSGGSLRKGTRVGEKT